MNFSTYSHRDSNADKESIPLSSRGDVFQVQRPKQRTVFGVLSENEQCSRSTSEGSHFAKHSSVSDSSYLNYPSCPSSSTYDVYSEEALGQEVDLDNNYLDTESDVLQNEDARLLLELNSFVGSCQDASVQSDADKSLLSGAFCVEYAEEIHQHLRESEEKFRAKPYLERHPEITSGMRVILVDWLAEVVQEFKLHSETLHLAVNYLDRFLSCTTYMKRGKLQLAGTAALLIAAKYEEILPPALKDLVYIADGTFTRKQLIQMERVILKLLEFNLATPTVNQFLHLFMSIHSVCANTENLALYIAELSLLEIEFLQYTPSIVAAGAYCLATYTINKSLWPNSLNAFSGYTMAKILPCLTNLHQLYLNADSHPQQAIREKYKSSKYCCVSQLTPPAALTFQ